MSSHYKWYPSSEETVVPFNAQYAFPSQSNKCVKTTSRIPPKSGSVFHPGSVIRVEFPAQGYVNALNTSLTFDVTMSAPSGITLARFQNNIQSIFSRVRLVYGSTPLEDIPNYNVIVRGLTEWTATNQNGIMDQTSIAEGIGGYSLGVAQVTGSDPPLLANVNVRQSYIQGHDNTNLGTTQAPGPSLGAVPNKVGNNAGLTGTCCTRTYQITFALGIMTQEKLLPTKWMASQLAIEMTLAPPESCIIQGDPATTKATYALSNVNLIPEIVEFDSSYDQFFLEGLRKGGVPLKFSSWHQYTFGTGGSNQMNLLIQERSRSVKALFAVQRRSPDSILSDSGALLYESAKNTDGGTLQSYQFRIGGRFYPASPVRCTFAYGTGQSNGGAEAFVELQKALNCYGDYRLSSSVNTNRWALPAALLPAGAEGPTDTTFQAGELDYECNIHKWNEKGIPTVYPTNSGTNVGHLAGTVGSSCFAMATSLETSNGIEISGLNAEEQSDISLIISYSGQQKAGYAIEVYALFDGMMILRENNVVGKSY